MQDEGVSKTVGHSFYVKLLLILAIGLLVKFIISGPVEIKITEKDLAYIIKNDYAEKIVMIPNKHIVEVRVYKKALKDTINQITQNKIDENNNLIIRYISTIFYRYYNNREYDEVDDVRFVMEIPNITVFDNHYQEMIKQRELKDKIYYETETRISILERIFSSLPLLLHFLLLFMFLNPTIFIGGKGGGMFTLGGNAKEFGPLQPGEITLKDVAGMHETKEEILDVISLLQNTSKITALGGKIPKGLLFAGPPGNGKTFLAKAIAGETKLPFFYSCASMFSTMYWGGGSAKVRSLFETAMKQTPCIIFIDEIDSIGRSRARRYSMNEDGENTLNTLLTYMDGFKNSNGVLIIGATNRIEILDDALLRPGRFDKHIFIDLPVLQDRIEVFERYLNKIKKAKNINIEALADQTAGFSCAEIANICNEATVIAAKEGKSLVSMQHIEAAIERIGIGQEHKNKKLSDHEKQVVAYHEAGHAIVSWLLPHCKPLVKISIIPRGSTALGYASYKNKEQFLTSKIEMEEEICALLGGRVAEELIFGEEEISTGASNDLEKVYNIAFYMQVVFGMNKKIGTISFLNSKDMSLKPYSNETSKLIDETIKILVDSLYNKTKEILTENKNNLESIAQLLLKKEVLYPNEVKEILGEEISIIKQKTQNNKKIQPNKQK